MCAIVHKNPMLVGSAPNRDNIKYFVKPLPKLDKFCHYHSSKIKQLGLDCPKTIIFCQRYIDCAGLYHNLRKNLCEYITFPPKYPVMPEFAIVVMYTRASKVEMKDKNLDSFCHSTGKLRVIIATSAFGMGIDCPDVKKIIHGNFQQIWNSMFRNQGGLDEMVNKLKLYFCLENKVNFLKKR